MQEEKIIFDSRDEKYKSPVGAVTSGTEVTFDIYVSNSLAPRGMKLVMKYDRHDEPAYYEMDTHLAEFDGIGFTVSVKIHDTGLYWYHFLLETDSGEIRIGKGEGGKAVISDDPVSWQQTVYKREYKVPDWIEGGSFYHIFVDRFRKGSSACPDVPDTARGSFASSSIDTAPPDGGADLGNTASADGDASPSSGDASGRFDPPLPAKIRRHDWGGVPAWRPVDGRVFNNDFFGGDLEGIIEKLPYLSDLGITCLYLSPIFEAYSSHKYDTGDYEKIDPMFGCEETLKELCGKASELGMRVILDGVFAHTGSDSKYFDKYGNYGGLGAWHNEDSPYRSWYFFHDDETYDSWWDFDTLPKINKNDPGYIEYMTGNKGIIRKWLKCGAAGWRLDVADELPVAFLDKLVKAAKSEKDDAIVIGEVWEDASNKSAYDERKNYFEGARLDSVMNYPFRNAIIDFVRNGNAGGISETVEQILENYPKEVVSCLMNLLGTHDSVRIITALAGEDLGQDPSREAQAETRLDQDGWERGIEMLKSASLLQVTLPGVPCVYYGDEAGTEGYKDPFNRTCYPWGYENKDLVSWYRKILNIRKSEPVYARGLYKTIKADDGVYAFMRYDGSAASGILITAVNAGSNEVTLDLNSALSEVSPEGHGAAGSDVTLSEAVWSNLLTGKTIAGSIVLAPGERCLLKKL